MALQTGPMMLNQPSLQLLLTLTLFPITCTRLLKKISATFTSMMYAQQARAQFASLLGQEFKKLRANLTGMIYTDQLTTVVHFNQSGIDMVRLKSMEKFTSTSEA